LPYAIALGGLGWFYKVCLCGYVIFTQLALLNVVTAIFVDSSMKAAMNDKQLVIQDEIQREGMSKTELENIFHEASEGNSKVLVQKLHNYLNDEQVKTYLKILDVHFKDPHDLVLVLDANHDGEVDLQEFVKGCLRLKSQRMVDMYSALKDIRPSIGMLARTLSSILQKVEFLEVTQPRLEGLHPPEGTCTDQMECGMNAFMFELKTAASNFQAASTQLQDSQMTLQDMYSSFGELHGSLHSTAGSIDRVSMQLKDCATSMHNMPVADQLARWQQGMQTSQERMVQQLDIILNCAKEKVNEDVGFTQRSWTGTTGGLTEGESCPTSLSPELTQRSFVDDVSSGNARGSHVLSCSNVKLAARLGPSFHVERSTFIAQRGDEDPAPEQPCAEYQSAVVTKEPEAQRNKSSRSCCHNSSDNHSFTCLHR